MKHRTLAIKLSLGALALGTGFAARAAAPVITNLTMVGATPRFGVHSDLGITNQIQCCTNLSQTNWVTLTNLLVAQSPYWFEHLAAPAASQRFYRVVALASDSPRNMALIPASSFTMGNCMNTNDGYPEELPLHTVYVSAFYVDRYLVTKALWDEVYQWAITNGYTFDYAGTGKATNHPVQTINWYDCVKWCNARSEKEGRGPAYYTESGLCVRYQTGQVNVQTNWVNWSSGYRLPTEAEWEKAARGGASGHRFPWADADTITHSRANYNSTTNYSYDISPTRGLHPTFNDGVFPYTSPVGYFAANGYGLYDMTGNVHEWCWDWYDLYSSGSQTDSRGPATGTYRVIRGSGASYEAVYCRTAFRNGIKPIYTFGQLGFRSVLPAGQ
jgi:formylglycine-generating enzyme required for sulfatase activity